MYYTDVKAKLWWTGRGWVYTVSDKVDGRTQVVLTDNTGGSVTKIPAGLFEQAELDALCVRRLRIAGHRFHKSWTQLVDEAPDF